MFLTRYVSKDRYIDAFFQLRRGLHCLSLLFPACLSQTQYSTRFCIYSGCLGSSIQRLFLYIMCIQVVERYSVCRCLYYRHAVDPCSARSQRGHPVQEKTVLVGYTCQSHSRSHATPTTHVQRQHPDSGYSSGGWDSQRPK